MTTEGQARDPHGARATRSALVGSVTPGLIPVPDIPEKVAKELATEPLGSSLEDEDKVRKAACGYRQRRRQEADESENDSETR